MLARLEEIKALNKQRLTAWVFRTDGFSLNSDAILDVQVKRLHEYKRQLLCAMRITQLQLMLHDDPDQPFQPRTFLFAAKAAPGYATAKRIIQLLCSLAADVNADPVCRGKLQVYFLPNYRVSAAEMLMPAAQVSEQISTAGKEASGTGNMKLMMNGAITLGTLDGANIEIADLAGRENEAIFGLTAPEVEQLWASNSYFAWDTLNGDRERLGRVMDELKDNTFAGLSGNFESIYNELMNNNDPDLVMADFRSYVDAWEKLTGSYGDQETWNRKALLNTASSGWFSSDRTIREYRDEIWHA